jgi:hypothetical protein
MNEWEAHTPEEFQRKWGQANGESMTNSAIIQALQSTGVNDGRAVRRMVEEYLGKERYQSLFSYKAGGKIVVMTDPIAVLRRTQVLALSNAAEFDDILKKVRCEVGDTGT